MTRAPSPKNTAPPPRIASSRVHTLFLSLLARFPKTVLCVHPGISLGAKLGSQRIPFAGPARALASCNHVAASLDRRCMAYQGPLRLRKNQDMICGDCLWRRVPFHRLGTANSHFALLPSFLFPDVPHPWHLRGPFPSSPPPCPDPRNRRSRSGLFLALPLFSLPSSRFFSLFLIYASDSGPLEPGGGGLKRMILTYTKMICRSLL